MNKIKVICASDDFLFEKEVEKVIKELDVSEFNISRYNFLDSDPLEILNDLQTISLLGDLKLVILKNPVFLKSSYNKEEIVKKYIEYFSLEDSDTYLLLLVDFKLENNLHINQVLKEKASFVILEDLVGEKLDEFIRVSFKAANLQIKNDAIKELITRTNGDLLLITNEIEKLKMAVSGNEVTFDDVINLVSKNLEDNIYNLLNAFLMNDKRKVLSIYNDFMAQNEDEMRILNAFENKLLEILYTKHLLAQGLKKDDVAAYFKVKPGRAYYMIENAKNMSSFDLKNLIKKITELDFNIKSGNIDKKLGLQLFILGA